MTRGAIPRRRFEIFTTEQRAWVTSFITPPVSGQSSSVAEPSTQGPVTDRLLGLPLPNLGDVTDMTSTCILDNKTAERLTLVNKSLHLDHGKFTRNPDIVIEPGGQANWTVENTKAPSWIPIIGGMSASGCEGHVQYALPDSQTTVTCHFKATFSGNAPLVGAGNNIAEMSADGPKKGTLTTLGRGGDTANGIYNFLVSGPGGGGTTPTVPGGGATPTPQVQASCLITIVNSTALPIALKHQSNETGDFMGTPPGSIAPGASAQFAYVQTPQGKDTGCLGSCTFEAGSPAAVTWRVQWANPVGQKNIASATLDPQTAGFGSLEQAGQGDENVPFTFTLSGGAAGVQPAPPGPTPVPFNPPPPGKEPTLRKGDKSPDGWVEYLQEALNTKGDIKLSVDGDFGAGTLKAVLAFQKTNHLQVDGTVGNQTWAALRDKTPEAPSTDGRAPHSFEQAGQQARFFTEKDPANWIKDADQLMVFLVSVGDTKIDGSKMTMRVTPPGGKPAVADFVIPAGSPIGSTDQGAMHVVTVDKFAATYASVPPGAPGTAYLIEAYLEQALGGDQWSGKPVPP